jgi:hypothetical protein
MSNQAFPFGQPFENTPQTNFTSDITIYEAYPGLIESPTEPNGVYVVFREVSGCSWWALNADFNVNTLRWEQNAPQNAANPAFALEQCSDGTLNRYVAAATEIAGSMVTWVPVWTIDPLGNMTYTPQTDTTSGQVASNLEPTWNGGTSVQMFARQIDLTDTSSDADSVLDNMIVNGTTVWQVRKDGTLVIGKIPFANVTGFMIPSGVTLNDATFTGTSTFNGPVVMTDGLTVAGGETVDNLTVQDALMVDGPATFYYTATVDGASTFNGRVTANDGMTVAGGLTTDSFHDTGNAQIDGNLTVNGSVTAASFDNPAGQAGSAIPAYTSGTFVLPAPGSSITIPVVSTYAFAPAQTIVVYDVADDYIFSASVISVNASPTTSITVLVEVIYAGAAGNMYAVGSKIYPGNGIMNVTSPDASVNIARSGNDITITAPAVAPVIPGSWYINTEYHAPATVTSGSLSLGPLPGTSADVFRIIYWGICSPHDASAYVSVTGVVSTGITWDIATNNYYNGQGNISTMMYFGTAKGGTTPTIDWALEPGQTILGTGYFATIAAGIQL